MYYSVIKHDGHLRTRGKVFSTFIECFQMTGVFYHSVIHGLGFFICFKMYRFYTRKTIKHAFSMFYALIKHGFLTNQSARRVLSRF